MLPNVNNIPKISVIIPTYNRVHLIRKAVQSVLDQSYQDFEIIVVDDCSTDNTEEAIREFQEKDERIRYIRHKKNKGAAAARNTGIRAAKGEYIAFQDSDDEWLPEKIEKQMKIIKNSLPEVGVVYTDMWRIKEGKKRYFSSPKIMPEDKIVYKQALDYRVSNIGIGTALIRKECFDKVGIFDKKFPKLEDLELFIRLSKYYYFYHIEEPLVKYFYTDKSISSDLKGLIVARKLILKKYFKDIKKDNKILANHYLGIGAALCINDKIEKGESYFIKAFNIYPNIKKDKKLLSRYYFNIGFNLCSIGYLSKGKKYFIKAIKIYPLDIRYSLMLIISVFGQKALSTIVEVYRKFKNII